MGWVIFYSCLLIFGIYLVYNAYNNFTNAQASLKEGVKTTATVSHFIESRGESTTLYKPVFTYTDKSQKVRSFENNVSSSSPGYDIGDKSKLPRGKPTRH